LDFARSLERFAVHFLQGNNEAVRQRVGSIFLPN
jgi:hypothetical protein